MATLSYNETKQRQLKLRHIFLPDTYGFICEVIVAVIALFVFNVSELSNQIFAKKFDNNNPDPLAAWAQTLKNILDWAQSYYAVQQVLLFLLWALAGAFLYILIFRIFQAIFGVKHSLGIGMRFMRQEHTKGILHWLASLHDFFLAATILILGSAAILFGSLISFGVASQELRNALTNTFPANMWEMAVAIVAAVISIRLIVFGFSLLSNRFRNWYTA